MSTDDLVEIQQLLARYAVTITQGDIDGLLATFTPDGSYSAFGDTYPLVEFPALVAAAPKGLFPGDRMLGRPGDGWRLATDLLPYERSTCFWHRIAYLYTRLDRLLAETAIPDEAALGSAYLALHTVRCRSHATQRRLAEGERLGPETSVDKVLLATAEQQLYDTARELLPGAVELTETPWRSEYLYSRAATIYGGTAEIQRNIIARRLLSLGRE